MYQQYWGIQNTGTVSTRRHGKSAFKYVYRTQFEHVILHAECLFLQLAGGLYPQLPLWNCPHFVTLPLSLQAPRAKWLKVTALPIQPGVLECGQP